MFLWLLLLVTVLWTVTFWYRRRHMNKLASALPAPKDELPLIGVAHTQSGNTEVAVDPVDLEMVLKTCMEKDDLHRFIRKVIGNGGIFAPGYQYALISVQTALSTVLRYYKVVEDREDGPIPKIKVKLDIMMKAVDGYQVALERIEKEKVSTLRL